MNIPFKKRYVLKTKLAEADRFISDAEAVLADIVEISERNKICVGIYEIIVNAIEHGNLEISFDEKQRALAQGKYETLINERAANKTLGARNVYVTMQITERDIHFIVEDEGAGFDWETVREKLFYRNHEALYRENGRGMFIAECYFDDISYNSKGNVAYLSKQIRKDKTASL